ncbi:MAG: NAD-dependent epimerase/dehydratase family protein [Aigarchaeota archaeon]|nr:NAD-dependent epimerase/dehydratase family protein [Aigarchaeota archaeon]MDW8092660.1 NAD-dependent epimerase/dehydratase family protein [Nitrososphaerota archaeon]
MGNSTGGIIVTGSRGFIGTKLITELKKRYEVFEFDVSLDPSMDILNREFVKTYIDEVKPDTIIHLAGNPSVKYSDINPVDDLVVNTIGTLNLLTALNKNNSRCHFIFASTAQIYGEPVDLPVSEEHVTEPITNYGVSKLACEKYVKNFGSRGVIKYTIFRIFNVYGPGQRPGFVIPDLIHKIKQLNYEEPLPLYASEQTSRDFIFVNDVVKIFTKAVELGGQNKVFNVCYGKEIRIIDLARQILKILGKESNKIVLKDTSNSKGVERLVGDPTKMQRFFDIKLTDFQHGIEETVKSYD